MGTFEVKILIAIVVSMLLASIGFGVGWKVCDWHRDAQELATLKQTVKDNATQSAQAAKATQEAAAQISASNLMTEKSVAQVTQSLGEQTHAFYQIDAQLVALNAGDCSLTVGANRLLDSAYSAAFGSAGPASQADTRKGSTSASGKAGSGHAKGPVASPSTPQSVPASEVSTGHASQPAVQ